MSQAGRSELQSRIVKLQLDNEKLQKDLHDKLSALNSVSNPETRVILRRTVDQIQQSINFNNNFIKMYEKQMEDLAASQYQEKYMKYKSKYMKLRNN